MIEKREHQRYPINEKTMRVYSHIKRGCYSVTIKDIGKGGAFIKTPYLLKEGEVISFELIDQSMKPIHMGNAIVARLLNETRKEEKGIGIMFTEQISDSILNIITANIK